MSNDSTGQQTKLLTVLPLKNDHYDIFLGESNTYTTMDMFGALMGESPLCSLCVEMCTEYVRCHYLA
jgi:hypothetical protein